MKNIFYLLTIVFLSLSCSKEDSTPTIPTPIWSSGEQKYGWVKAKKNGQDFQASAHAIRHKDLPNKYFSLQFFTYEGFANREEYSFNKIEFISKNFEVKGRHNLDYDGYVGSVYGTSASDGDLAEDVYYLDDSKINTLTITYLDTLENIIRGSFDVSFIITDSREKVNPNNPDRVRLSEGTFEVKLID